MIKRLEGVVMRKSILFLLIFSISILTIIPKPIMADSNDTINGLAIACGVGAGLILVLVLAEAKATEDRKERFQAAQEAGIERQKKKDAEMAAAFDEAIGNATYDDCIIKYGKPDDITEGDEVFIASWSRTKTSYLGMGSVTGNSYYPEAIGFSIPVTHGEFLTLIFDKKTKLLKQWKYERK